jgi:SAM-dependent MidA family methyltransferase
MLSPRIADQGCLHDCLQLAYTLQVHVLDQTGLADITADVNFAALRRSVASIKGTTSYSFSPFTL